MRGALSRKGIEKGGKFLTRISSSRRCQNGQFSNCFPTVFSNFPTRTSFLVLYAYTSHPNGSYRDIDIAISIRPVPGIKFKSIDIDNNVLEYRSRRVPRNCQIDMSGQHARRRQTRPPPPRPTTHALRSQRTNSESRVFSALACTAWHIGCQLCQWQCLVRSPPHIHYSHRITFPSVS